MVDTHETPDYKGSTHGRPARPTAPRKLSEMEFKQLQELLPIYETSLREISQKRAADMKNKVKLSSGDIDNIRKQLFTGKSRTTGKILTEDRLLPNWRKYIKFNFNLGPYTAVAELRNMVDTHETPDYKGSKHKGSTQREPARPIAPRKLSEMEFKEL